MNRFSCVIMIILVGLFLGLRTSGDALAMTGSPSGIKDTVEVTEENLSPVVDEGVAPDTGVDDEWAEDQVQDTTDTETLGMEVEASATDYSEDLYLN